MKKNKPFRRSLFPSLKKILLIMRNAAFLLILGILQAYAVDSYSQKTKLTLDFSDTELIKVLDNIEIESEFYFLYNEKLLDTDRKVSIDVNNQPINTILDNLFAGTDVKYTIIDRKIILAPEYLTTNENVADLVQQMVITGKVTDAQTGEAMPGVNVLVVGTSIGVITDLSGSYSVLVTDRNAKLKFSFIGYETQEIPLSGRSTIDVKLVSEVTGLDEVVVIGYGTQKRSNVTGSVASMSASSIKDRPLVSGVEAMVGQVAGVQIQQISGAPGVEGLSIRVRGTGSITQSSEPLYVVDGYPMEAGAFRLLNTSNIDKIEILKDASSTAIYGSRGANGVVVITTKQGKGNTSLNFNIYTGFQQPERYFKMMNRDQFIEYFIDGRNQAWLDAALITADPDQSPHSINDPNSRRKLYPNAATQYLIPDGTDGYIYNFQDPASVAQMPDNDWQKLLFRNALIQNYELTLSGGNERTQYLISTSYLKQDGIVINTDYNKININSNVTSQIGERLKVGLNMNSFFTSSNEQVSGKYSPIQIALQLPPIFPVYNADGTYGSMVRNYDIFAGDVASPIGMAEQTTTNRKRNGWMGILFAELEIIKDLTYKISINGGIQENNRKYYLPSYVDMDASRAPRIAQGNNAQNTDIDWVIEQTLNYRKVLADKHDFQLLAGYTTQKHSYTYLYGESRGFPNDNILTLNAGTMYNLTNTESEYSMISYLSRVNYAFDNKYLVSVAFRSDGSSRFGAKNRWGSFPSVSLGWRLKQESFMQNIDVINDLKLRGSFGISGNNRIGNYSGIGLLNIGYYPTGDALQNTVNPNTMPNDNLGWEKTKQVNLGIDLGLFKNRIHFEADLYSSKSLELLLNVPVPTITGYSTQMQNVGKLQNKGVEFLLSTKNLVNTFKWSSDFNISFNKNKVLELGPGGQPIFASAPNASNAFITKIGQPVACFYGYVYDGVYMSEQELEDNPHLSKDKVGDGRYVDVNKDGVLDANDKTILGNNQPIFTAGFNNTFSYKNLSLALQFTASYGAEIFSIYKRMIAVYHGDRNGMIEVIDRWRSPEEPGNGMIFRASRTPSGWSRDPSSLWVTDGSYLRLRNASLSYEFDDQIIRRLDMKSLRVYLTCQNLFTITKNPGYDPETSSEGDGLTRGGDYTGYPAARSVILGFNVTF
ncbi:MAG TPA: TonB-dependent receptor [Paludibacter sp.]|nr:TonB-dependent receptor [Paludibacter sp.]